MYNLFRPFGPYILECICPDDVLKSFNDFVNSGKYSKDQNPPDMLDRGFEIIFLTRNQLNDIGFTTFISQVAPQLVMRA